jgi:tetratricopeptide (TPR) repeat protein
MYAVLMKEPAPLSDEIPPLLRQIIYKALEKDRELNGRPERRYQSAAEMRADLENFLEWFSSQPAVIASPFETLRVSPDSQPVEMATRMRIPARTERNPLPDLWRALTGRRLSPAIVLALILTFGSAVALVSFFIFSEPSSSNSAISEAADANLSNANSAPPDDAEIRAAKEFHRQADELYSRRKFDRAIETYTLAIELNPNDYALFNNRGAAFHADRQYQKAIADYTRAIELNPYHFSAYNNRGAAFEDLGNVEQAVADYRKALELDPENKLAKDNLKKILK